GTNNIGVLMIGGGTTANAGGKLAITGTGGPGAGAGDDGVDILGAQPIGHPLSIQGTVLGTNPGDVTVKGGTLPLPILAVNGPNGSALVNGATFSYTATAVSFTSTVASVNQAPGQILDKEPVSLAFFDANGVKLPGAPKAVGNYTVEAAFPGSTN